MKTKYLPAILFAAFAAISCEKKELAVNADPGMPANAFDSFFTDQPIAEPKAIHVARTTAKPGDEIVINGLVMGREKVFVDGRASFLLGDREKLTPCNAVPGDECETPWDACCDSKEAKLEGIASIQIVDAEGRVLSGGLKGVHGLKELSAVTVSGTVDKSSTPENFVINAKSISVAKP
jgi:hypothetical protein